MALLAFAFAGCVLIDAGGRRVRRTAEELQAEADKLESMVAGVRKQLQLSGLCEYVDVRARDHVNMKYAGRRSRQRTELLQPIVVADAVILHSRACTQVLSAAISWPRPLHLCRRRFGEHPNKSIVLAKCLCTEE